MSILHPSAIQGISKIPSESVVLRAKSSKKVSDMPSIALEVKIKISEKLHYF